MNQSDNDAGGDACRVPAQRVADSSNLPTPQDDKKRAEAPPPEQAGCKPECKPAPDLAAMRAAFEALPEHLRAAAAAIIATLESAGGSS
jgi:hypothetical protein